RISTSTADRPKRHDRNLRGETVTFAPHRLDAIGAFPQFFAQATDMGVDRARINGVFVTPDILEQYVAGLHAAAALYEEAKQFEFGGGRVEALAGQRNFEGALVDSHVAAFHPAAAVTGGLGPPHEG